jgi:hypothetical protein
VTGRRCEGRRTGSICILRATTTGWVMLSIASLPAKSVAPATRGGSPRHGGKLRLGPGMPGASPSRPSDSIASDCRNGIAGTGRQTRSGGGSGVDPAVMPCRGGALEAPPPKSLKAGMMPAAHSSSSESVEKVQLAP